MRRALKAVGGRLRERVGYIMLAIVVALVLSVIFPHSAVLEDVLIGLILLAGAIFAPLTRNRK
jgi:hypothetical protein